MVKLITYSMQTDEDKIGDLKKTFFIYLGKKEFLTINEIFKELIPKSLLNTSMF